MTVDRTIMLEYVLHHLGYHIAIDERKGRDLREQIKIIFPSSDALAPSNDPLVIYGIPVIFPIGTNDGHFTVVDGILKFHHDLIRSAFYLLSGQQEVESRERDNMGRFPYDRSIQKRCGFTTKPVVNYYFQVIIDGLRELYGSVEVINRFNSFALALSHDIDVIDSYDRYAVGHKVKQLLGLATSKRSFMEQLRITLKHSWRGMFSKKNPAWSFDKLMRLAKERGFRSTFFFLPKDQLHVDSYYSFSDGRIKDVMKRLQADGFEVGLHGTVRSATDAGQMKAITKNLHSVIGSSTTGIRQHRLTMEYPTTLAHQQAAGLKYDASLGFAEHEGFRNSYCHPFKPFDPNKQRMMDHWCIPLNAMDVTLLHYRGLSHAEILSALEGLIDEIKKFDGVLSVLWHNDKLDDEEWPGIPELYIQLLDQLKMHGAEGLTSMAVIKRMEAT